MEIAFIGTGNVATNLSRIFFEKGHKIIQIIGHTASSASSLARSFKCPFSSDYKELVLNADLYFLCVKDDVIEEIIKDIPVVNGMMVHTSGSTSMEIMITRFENCGVFYPLQSFSKFKKIDLSDTPILIEANSPENEILLKDFSKNISSTISIMNSNQRMAIHICGVFAGNFANHMYSLSHHLAKKHNLPFEYLFPLISETAEKIKHRAPIASQTGPAVRKDLVTLQKHKEFLKTSPDLTEIYETISESIIKFSR